MSVSAHIKLRIVDIETRNLPPPLRVIEKLLNNGWRIKRGEYICYLPLGDNDDFD